MAVAAKLEVGFVFSNRYQPCQIFHTGSVWPHDNSLIAMGSLSVGAVEQALEVAQGILEMTIHQPYHRPPPFPNFSWSEVEILQTLWVL